MKHPDHETTHALLAYLLYTQTEHPFWLAIAVLNLGLIGLGYYKEYLVWRINQRGE